MRLDRVSYVTSHDQLADTVQRLGTRPDGTDLKWKQIGVTEITDSREIPFFIQWLTEDHPSQDGKAVAVIEKIAIADTEQLSDSWFKSEILDGLIGTDFEFIDLSTNEGESGIVGVHLKTPSGVVRLD
jgi:Glyoxalase-like domain